MACNKMRSQLQKPKVMNYVLNPRAPEFIPQTLPARGLITHQHSSAWRQPEAVQNGTETHTNLSYHNTQVLSNGPLQAQSSPNSTHFSPPHLGYPCSMEGGEKLMADDSGIPNPHPQHQPHSAGEESCDTHGHLVAAFTASRPFVQQYPSFMPRPPQYMQAYSYNLMYPQPNAFPPYFVGHPQEQRPMDFPGLGGLEEEQRLTGDAYGVVEETQAVVSNLLPQHHGFGEESCDTQSGHNLDDQSWSSPKTQGLQQQQQAAHSEQLGEPYEEQTATDMPFTQYPQVQQPMHHPAFAHFGTFMHQYPPFVPVPLQCVQYGLVYQPSAFQPYIVGPPKQQRPLHFPRLAGLVEGETQMANATCMPEETQAVVSDLPPEHQHHSFEGESCKTQIGHTLDGQSQNTSNLHQQQQQVKHPSQLGEPRTIFQVTVHPELLAQQQPYFGQPGLLPPSQLHQVHTESDSNAGYEQEEPMPRSPDKQQEIFPQEPYEEQGITDMPLAQYPQVQQPLHHPAFVHFGPFVHQYPPVMPLPPQYMQTYQYGLTCPQPNAFPPYAVGHLQQQQPLHFPGLGGLEEGEMADANGVLEEMQGRVSNSPCQHQHQPQGFGEESSDTQLGHTLDLQASAHSEPPTVSYANALLEHEPKTESVPETNDFRPLYLQSSCELSPADSLPLSKVMDNAEEHKQATCLQTPPPEPASLTALQNHRRSTPLMPSKNTALNTGTGDSINPEGDQAPDHSNPCTMSYANTLKSPLKPQRLSKKQHGALQAPCLDPVYKLPSADCLPVSKVMKAAEEDNQAISLEAPPPDSNLMALQNHKQSQTLMTIKETPQEPGRGDSTSADGVQVSDHQKPCTLSYASALKSNLKLQQMPKECAQACCLDPVCKLPSADSLPVSNVMEAAEAHNQAKCLQPPPPHPSNLTALQNHSRSTPPLPSKITSPDPGRGDSNSLEGIQASDCSKSCTMSYAGALKNALKPQELPKQQGQASPLQAHCLDPVCKIPSADSLPVSMIMEAVEEHSQIECLHPPPPDPANLTPLQNHTQSTPPLPCKKTSPNPARGDNSPEVVQASDNSKQSTLSYATTLKSTPKSQPLSKPQAQTSALRAPYLEPDHDLPDRKSLLMSKAKNAAAKQSGQEIDLSTSLSS